MATRAGPPPARLYFTPPSAGGDELPPLAAQVLSAWRGEAEGRRQLSGPEGQLISFRLWEIYDPPPTPPRTKLCLLGSRKHKSGRSGSERVSARLLAADLLRSAKGGPSCVWPGAD